MPQLTKFTPENTEKGKRALRHALGRFATGVTVISALGQDGEKVAITANSFSSVSLDPALVLWSIDNASPNLDSFDVGKPFAVHILTKDQAEIARHCARSSYDKFNFVEHTVNAAGVALIRGADTVFECRVVATHIAGDHTIIVGAVTQVSVTEGPINDMLVFAGGQFASLTET